MVKVGEKVRIRASGLELGSLLYLILEYSIILLESLCKSPCSGPRFRVRIRQIFPEYGDIA